MAIEPEESAEAETVNTNTAPTYEEDAGVQTHFCFSIVIAVAQDGVFFLQTKMGYLGLFPATVQFSSPTELKERMCSGQSRNLDTTSYR